MNADDDIYHRYVQAQQQASQYDRASMGSLIAFTILLAYIAYYALLSFGLHIHQVLTPIKLQVDKMLTQLGVLPRRAVANRPRRISTGSQALDGALSGMLSPLKAAAGDRTLRTLGTLMGGGRYDNPPGLGNWDNSCYQNSVVQGLASLRPLESFLERVLATHGNPLNDSTNRSLFDTITLLNDRGNNGKVLWMPNKLKSMSSWQQQDAQEYLSKILDEVDRELVRISRNNSNVPGLEENGATHQIMAKSSREGIVANPLEGFLAQRVSCTQCGYSEGLSMIPFNCLTVPLGREPSHDIEACLDEYTNLEAIEGVECAKCTLLRTKMQLEQLAATAASSPGLQASVNSRLQAVKEVLESEDFTDKALTTTCQIPKKSWSSTTKSRQAVVARAPKCLVVHFNRSVFNEMTGAQTKNYADVSFPLALDLAPWCLGQQDAQREKWSMNPRQSMLSTRFDASTPSIMYNLRAAVTHYGRHENGHYICYRKHPTVLEEDSKKDVKERWWRLSDEDVSPVSEQEVLQQGGVFMLFYEQDTQPAPLPETNWTDVASAVALPAETVGGLELEPHEEIELLEADTTQASEHEQSARATALDASRSSLLAELRNVLPPTTADAELTAIGQAEEDSGSDSVPDNFQGEDEHAHLQVGQPSSSFKLRTAGLAGHRRNQEAWDSSLRMASAF